MSVDVLCFKRCFQSEQNVKVKGKKMDTYWLQQQRQVYMKTQWDIERAAPSLLKSQMKQRKMLSCDTHCTKCPGTKMAHQNCPMLSQHVLEIQISLEHNGKLQQAILAQYKHFCGKYFRDFLTMQLHVSLICPLHVANPSYFQGLSG